MIDWQLTIPGVELRSLNKDLRGTTVGARMASSAMAKEQRTGASMMCWTIFGQAPPPPLIITITRVGPRELDSDNLAGSAKHVRDGISDWLDVNDRDKRLKWEYLQKLGKYGVKIRVQTWRQTFAEYLLANSEYQKLHAKCLKLAACAMDDPSTRKSLKKWESLADRRDKLEEKLMAEWRRNYDAARTERF